MAPATQTLKPGDPDLEYVMPLTSVLVPHLSLHPTIVAQSASSAVRAKPPPGVPGRDFYVSTRLANIGDLEVGQA
jgi:hypothetical protein